MAKITKYALALIASSTLALAEILACHVTYGGTT